MRAATNVMDCENMQFCAMYQNSACKCCQICDSWVTRVLDHEEGRREWLKDNFWTDYIDQQLEHYGINEKLDDESYKKFLSLFFNELAQYGFIEIEVDGIYLYVRPVNPEYLDFGPNIVFKDTVRDMMKFVEHRMKALEALINSL